MMLLMLCCSNTCKTIALQKFAYVAILSYMQRGEICSIPFRKFVARVLRLRARVSRVWKIKKKWVIKKSSSRRSISTYPPLVKPIMMNGRIRSWLPWHEWIKGESIRVTSPVKCFVGNFDRTFGLENHKKLKHQPSCSFSIFSTRQRLKISFQGLKCHFL